MDEETLVGVIQRVSQLAGDHPRIAELDINPFLAEPGGGVALDARIRLGGEAASPEPGVEPGFDGEAEARSGSGVEEGEERAERGAIAGAEA